MSQWALCYLLRDLPNGNNAFQNKRIWISYRQRVQITAICLVFLSRSAYYFQINPPPPPTKKKIVCCWLNLEVRTSITTRRWLKLFIEFNWCLCEENARWALDLSFLVFSLFWMYQDPLSLAAQCVCMSVCFCESVCALWLHGFAWNFITPSTHTHTHTHTSPFSSTLCSSTLTEWSRSPRPFQGYRFADKRSNVSMGCVSVVGLFKSSSPLVRQKQQL